ncbi:endolytic transglycosylase MltG [Patescibacteria group bacterium]|nr:endolytic transglycosylase MltG [Patescibacteria group bacterium]
MRSYEEIKLQLIAWFNVPQNKKNFWYLSISLILLFSFYRYLHLPPQGFPLGQVFTVDNGESLQDITNNLYKAKIIKSPLVFRSTVIVLGGEKKVKAGDYLLDKAEGPFDIASRLVSGEYHIPVAKLTIPEGWNIFQIADYMQKNLINFDKPAFLLMAKKEEGYLFPDTYFMSLTIQPETIINSMNNNFIEKIKTVTGIATSTHSLKDIITMASILEAEARTTQSRRIISGILWKRLQLGMALQVDSTFSYVNGKNTYELTAKDLTLESPYNTYKYAGLPPGPIDNPGLDAIFSAVNPITTNYLYFLSSKSGDMYYANTFEEHKRNRELYLNK